MLEFLPFVIVELVLIALVVALWRTRLSRRTAASNQHWHDHDRSPFEGLEQVAEHRMQGPTS